MNHPRALTIAGSDSGGGAGIQADLKTFAALGVYGMSAITSVTAQNTVEVRCIRDLPPDVVAAQIDAVLEDIGADAVKTGMLSSVAIIEAVADSLQRFKVLQLVVDPVMVSKSGAALLQADAQDALKKLLLPMALLLTPNIPEAEVLSGKKIRNAGELFDAAEIICDMGVKNLLIKGGHLPGEEVADYFFGEVVSCFSAERIHTKNTHGTGCTLSAAICAYLAKGLGLEEAIAEAGEYLQGCIAHADELKIGRGHGPLHHGWDEE